MSIQPIALDKKSAAEFVLLSESTVDNLVRENKFPKPRQVSKYKRGKVDALDSEEEQP